MLELFGGIRRTFARLQRYRHIMAVLMKYGFEELAGVVGRHLKVGIGSKGIPTATQRQMTQVGMAQRVRLAMQELGPTFIKLGQLLSTRPDLLPVEFIQELELLQDSVTPDQYPRIREEFKNQLGAYPEDIFERFDPEPIAAASIAQVHRARTQDGCEVVVKIRRPGIVKTIKTELEILNDMARLMRGRFAAPENFDPQRMVREFSDAVHKEVDYANERRNQQRFIKNFADDPTIHIPRVFERYCSEGILTMEYIDGIKPSQIDRLRQRQQVEQQSDGQGQRDVAVTHRAQDLGRLRASRSPGHQHGCALRVAERRGRRERPLTRGKTGLLTGRPSSAASPWLRRPLR